MTGDERKKEKSNPMREKDLHIKAEYMCWKKKAS